MKPGGSVRSTFISTVRAGEGGRVGGGRRKVVNSYMLAVRGLARENLQGNIEYCATSFLLGYSITTNLEHQLDVCSSTAAAIALQ